MDEVGKVVMVMGLDPSGEGQDGSGSIITDLNIIDISANAGFGAPKFNPVDAGSNHQGATKGGASGGGLAGGNFDISYNGNPPGGFRVWPVAGGGGGGSVGVGGNGSVNNLDISSGDASGGIGGIGFLSDISGTSTYYGVGGGGGALPYKYDNTGIGVWVDASGIGGSSCGNALDPSGGHGGPSSTIHDACPRNLPHRNILAVMPHVMVAGVVAHRNWIAKWG